jgi:sugar phosphate permease
MAEAPIVGRRRWGIGLLLGAGILINYFDRVNISVAAPQLQQEFGLTPADLGLLFSAFFWSYAILQIPVGIVLDRLGVTTVSRIGAFLWGVASGVVAFATGFGSIFAARVLLGVAERQPFPPIPRRQAIGSRAASARGRPQSSTLRRNSPMSLACHWWRSPS